jgi:hypothetical protein
VKKSWYENHPKILAVSQTVLSILEKVVDAVPGPGIKLRIGAVSDIIKVLEVHDFSSLSLAILSLCIQASADNKESISDVIKTVKNGQKALANSIASALDPSLVASLEGKECISELLQYVSCCISAVRTSSMLQSKAQGSSV